MESFEITMSLPPKELSPNARPHWAAKSRAAKAHRMEARVMTPTALLDVALGVDWSVATVRPMFFHKTRHKRDRDNLSASLKAARDGIADAMAACGLGEAASGFVPLPPTSDVDREEPRVEIIVTARPDLSDVVE